MKQIRHSCFETNSSSMHSLIIKKENSYPPIEELEDIMSIYRVGREEWINENNSNKIDLHIYRINDDIYYGRHPFTVLSDIKDKLKYYVASECKTKEDIKNVEKVLHEIFDNIKEIKFASSMNKDWGNGDYDQYGYAQNYGYFTKALEENDITLKEFLINDKYVVIVDGDEYQEFEKMKDSGIIDFKKIDKIYTWPDGGWEYTKYDNNGNEVEHKTSWDNYNTDAAEFIE